MDNKKYYKRFSTIFWWSFTILPLLVLLLGFVGSAIISLDSIVGTESDVETYYAHWFSNIVSIGNANNVFSFFNNFSMPALTQAFEDLFNLFGITEYTLFGMLFGYMVSIQVYHIVFDVVVWLPHLAHDIMERWC